MNMTARDVKYAQQPAYNESVMPSCPPTYAEAVGSNSDKHLYPSVPPVHTIQQPAAPSPYVTPSPYVAPTPQVVTVPLAVGPNPSVITCPSCQVKVTTKTRKSCTKGAHIACFVLCIFGCCLCSCIPYCMDSFSTVHHTCPICKSYLGTYRN